MRGAVRGLALASWLSVASLSAQTFEVVHQFPTAAGPMLGRILPGAGGVLYGTLQQGGTFGGGSVFSLTPDGAGGFTYSDLHVFAGPEGKGPVCALIQSTDGALYGTGPDGGASDLGTVFRIELSGELTVLHDFSGSDGAHPNGGLALASDGNFYGTTSSLGNGHGTVFRMDSSGALTTVHAFDGTDGDSPLGGLIQASDGAIYGTTSSGGATGNGTIFKIDASGAFTSVHSFSGSDGGNPAAGLIQASDGALYGVTASGGTGSSGVAFKIDLSGTLTTLYSFRCFPDGCNPKGELVQGPDGNFYGVTPSGGPPMLADGGFVPTGTVFRIDSAGNFTMVGFFSLQGDGFPHAGLALASDDFIYGATTGNFLDSSVGGVFRFPAGGSLDTVHAFRAMEGANPFAPLTQGADGLLYGTNSVGSLSSGNVFSLSLDGRFTVLKNFGGGLDGASPLGRLLQTSDGSLYGTTQDGGDHGFGVVFRIDPSGSFSTLHAFDGTDGSGPSAGLILANDGNFYGTAPGSGANNVGTIFRMDSLGGFTPLRPFDEPGGGIPRGQLLQASDGLLYGTTTAFGASGGGTVYSIDTSGTFTPLHDFGGPDGNAPHAGLIQASDGNLYGTTAAGGASDDGTVYAIDTSGAFSPLHDFSGSDGRGSHAELVQASDGNFYGTTTAGGASDDGTVFRMDSSGNVTTLHSFTGVDGADPEAGLLVASDGRLYGTTYSGGPAGLGGIFRVSLSTGPPSLARIEPTSGRAAGGAFLLAYGAVFLPGASLSIGGVAARSADFTGAVMPVVAPALAAGTLNDVTVTNLDASSATLPLVWFADFLDLPRGDIFHSYVETIFRNGITAGCGGGNYCPNASVSRQQMAVFLLKAMHGSSYVPPPCQGIFTDVPCPSLFAAWIEELAAEGVTGGCGGSNYCPQNPVRRDQMAVFLLKSEHGSSYAPPTCAGVFGDVPCPSQFADWIEQLAAEAITGGCGGGNYCPSSSNTRGQMAVFLVKTFNLQ